MFLSMYFRLLGKSFRLIFSVFFVIFEDQRCVYSNRRGGYYRSGWRRVRARSNVDRGKMSSVGGYSSTRCCGDGDSPFVDKVTSIVNSLFLHQRTRVRMMVKLLFGVVFYTFGLNGPLFSFFQGGTLTLLFFRPFSFFFRFSLNFCTIRQGLEGSFFGVDRGAVRVFFVFRIALFFFSVFVCGCRVKWHSGYSFSYGAAFTRDGSFRSSFCKEGKCMVASIGVGAIWVSYFFSGATESCFSTDFFIDYRFVVQRYCDSGSL